MRNVGDVNSVFVFTVILISTRVTSSCRIARSFGNKHLTSVGVFDFVYAPDVALGLTWSKSMDKPLDDRNFKKIPMIDHIYVKYYVLIDGFYKSSKVPVSSRGCSHL